MRTHRLPNGRAGRREGSFWLILAQRAQNVSRFAPENLLTMGWMGAQHEERSLAGWPRRKNTALV